jgi:hypothetical protein
MWGFSPEEMAAWAAIHPAPVITKERFRCDICKQWMSPLETMINYSGLYCHSTKKCLPKFAKKHNWDGIDMKKKQQLINTGDSNE